MKTFTLKEINEFYRDKLATDKHWATRALEVIGSYQLESELEAHETRVHNGVGFTVWDADFLTSLYKQLKGRGQLSVKQVEILLKRMPKYAGQLVQKSLSDGTLFKVKRGCYSFTKE